MTQEDKNLLYKYLCMALPYKVIIQEFDDEYGYNDYELKSIESDYFSENDPCIEGWYLNRIENVKPYLRPMSSMTEEESNELESITFPLMEKDWDGNENPACIRLIDVPKYMNFILSNHFDFMGLIPKGLAIEVTESNNPYKN